MLANDLKKGDRVLLKNGWYATVKDNLKGNTRLALVEGFVTEMGSIYTHDIAFRIGANGMREPVELSPRQAKVSARIKAMGF